ncbi:MAG: hypothetical protein WBA48_19190, partial [Xanthobacteraceae bacterium]
IKGADESHLQEESGTESPQRNIVAVERGEADWFAGQGWRALKAALRVKRGRPTSSWPDLFRPSTS